jgi:hypothetical protein
MDFLLFREQELKLKPRLPLCTAVRMLNIIVSCNRSIDRIFPVRKIFPIPPPKGTVHRSSLSASQFAVIAGAVVTYIPLGKGKTFDSRSYLTKGVL